MIGLHVPVLPEGVDTLKAALAYAEAGWFVVPVAAGTKNPGSVVGGRWEEKSSRDPQQLVAWYAGTDYGIALHVGRSGAVVFDIDSPNSEGLAELVAELDAVGAPVQTTRLDGSTRHYLVLTPAGREVGNSSRSVGVAKVDIRGKNGVIVVAPTPHVKAATGGGYAWLRPGLVPAPSEVLAARMRDAGESFRRLDGAATGAYLGLLAEGPMCPKVAEALAAIEWNVGGRFEAARDRQMALVGLGASGHRGVREALHELERAFREKTAGERRDPTEWSRALAGALSAAAGRAPAPAPFDPCAPPVPKQLPEGFAIPAVPVVVPTTVPAGRRADGTDLRSLPAEFWTARPIHAVIRQAAHSRGASCDVAFYGVLARLAASIPHTIRADSGIGSLASLNLFAALIGPSGTGKTLGLGPAKSFRIGGEEFAEFPLGSGEGVAESFMGDKEVADFKPDGTPVLSRDGATPKMKKVRAQVRHNVLFHTDEGQGLTKLIERAGSTIGETLRSAWVGETIGQKNGKAETTRVIESDSYSVGLTIGFQEETAMPLLDDAEAGTPQRFMWVWTKDESIPDEKSAPFPIGTTLGVLPDVSGRRIEFEPSIQKRLYAAHVAKARGQVTVAQLDSHKPLMLVKLSALLARIDGRHQVTEDDWSLAEVMWGCSAAVRDHLRAVAAAAKGKARADEVEAYVGREGAAERVRTAVRAEGERSEAYRRAAKLAAKVHERPEQVITIGKLRELTTAAWRPQLGELVDIATAQGWLAVTDDGAKIERGQSQPASMT